MTIFYFESDGIDSIERFFVVYVKNGACKRDETAEKLTYSVTMEMHNTVLELDKNNYRGFINIESANSNVRTHEGYVNALSSRFFRQTGAKEISSSSE